MGFFVYFIESTNGSTYIGATVDLDKRLRQHNGEITGGAVMTTSKVKKGKNWSRMMMKKSGLLLSVLMANRLYHVVKQKFVFGMFNQDK